LTTVTLVAGEGPPALKPIISRGWKADEEIWKARANRHRLALFLEQHRFIPPDTEDRAVIAAGFQKLVELLCSDEAELLR